LGRELAKVLQEAGRVVVNVSRRPCEFAEYNFLHDLTHPQEIEAAAKEICALKEPLEAVVNAAAVMSVQPLGKVTAAEVTSVMDTNIKGAILLVSALADRIDKDGTDVVNVSSTVGAKGYVEQAAYGASKWAMRGFSQNLQAEFRGKPSRVISFCVGGMRTRMGEKIGLTMTDPENWMDPHDIAVCLQQLLDLPKSVEVSEIVINRKSA
jgi:3-oxoacyl-[acyl-carrier protein] reductase